MRKAATDQCGICTALLAVAELWHYTLMDALLHTLQAHLWSPIPVLLRTMYRNTWRMHSCVAPAAAIGVKSHLVGTRSRIAGRRSHIQAARSGNRFVKSSHWLTQASSGLRYCMACTAHQRSQGPRCKSLHMQQKELQIFWMCRVAAQHC
jgi:hypothetical protein